MTEEERIHGEWHGVGRRLHQWAWETNHNDTVPTTLAGLIPLAFLVPLVAAYASPWMALALILSPLAVVVCARGRREVHEAHRTIEDIQREVRRPSADERSRSSVGGGV